ncbi:MAG: Omp28-related outer membrane protein [Chitinophagales bacterium]
MRKLFTLFTLSAGLLPALHAQTILIEDFEGGVFPSGWSQETTASDGGWLVGTDTELESGSFPIPTHTTMIATNDDGCDCDKMNDILITPSLDLSSYSNVMLSFAVFYTETPFDSYENATVEVSTDGGTSWTVVKDLSGSTAWRTENVFLGDYAGMSDVKIAINYTDDGGWAYGIAIDDFQVNEAVPVVDAALTSISTYQFQQVGDPATISGIITNNGTVVITSFDLSWSDGSSTFTDNISGITLNPFDTYTFTHSTPYIPSEAITYNLDVEVANPNATIDELLDNNMNTAKVSGCSYIPPKNVLAEEATGTWCGWCPRGSVFMDQMAADYPETFIGVAVHNSDPMEVTAYDNGVGSFPGFSGYPSVIVERNGIIDPSELPSWYTSRIDDIQPLKATIEATYNEGTGEGTATVTAEFVTELTSIDYRFNFILTEDNVTGTTSGYDQTNYYAGGGYGEMGGYEDLPSNVDAEDMVYDFVARTLDEGWDGTEGSIPTSVVADDVATYTYSFEIEDDWEVEEMNAIVFVINNETGEILNSATTKIAVVQAVSEIVGIDDIDLYPNPAADYANLVISLSEAKDISIRITDINGSLVAEKNYGVLTGDVLLPVNTMNFSAGIYNIDIITGAEHTSQKLVIAK